MGVVGRTMGSQEGRELVCLGVAVNPAITDSYHTIKTKWSFTDLLDAHIALEAMRDIKAETHG